jgi:hypothetical protein
MSLLEKFSNQLSEDEREAVEMGIHTNLETRGSTPIREEVIAGLGATASFDAHFHPEEWGPEVSKRARQVHAPDRYILSDQ